MRPTALPLRFSGLALLLTLLASGRSSGQALGLDEFIHAVLERQPRLAEDSIAIDQARGQVSQLYRQAILPKFQLTTAFGPAPGFHYQIAPNGVDTVGRDFSWWPLGPYFGTELEIAQPLNVDRFRSGLKAARAGVRVAEARFEGKRQDEVKEGLSYWFGFQYACRMVSLLEQAEVRLDSVQNELQKKIDAQDESASLDDLLNLKVGRFTLEKGLIDARVGRERARGALVFFLALPSASQLVLRDSLLKPLPELPGMDTLLERFQHPDLAQLDAGLAATRALVEVQRGALGPDIFLFAKFSYTKGWVANRDEQNRDVLVTDPINSVAGAFGLGVRWNLNYWAQQSTVRRAELEWHALRRKQVYARTGLELLFKDSWLRYQALGEKAQAAKRAIDATEALLEGIVAAMDLDPDRAKDLIGPYKSWIDLQSQYYDLVNQRNLAAVEVLRNAGLVTQAGYLTRP